MHRVWHDTQALARMARAESGPAGEPIELAYRLRDMRDAREEIFGRLFADPGWDLMLALYIAELEGQQLGQAALLCMARLNRAVGMRWLSRLEEAELVTALTDPAVKRGRVAILTEKGRTTMASALEKMR